MILGRLPILQWMAIISMHILSGLSRLIEHRKGVNEVRKEKYKVGYRRSWRGGTWGEFVPNTYVCMKFSNSKIFKSNIIRIITLEKENI